MARAERHQLVCEGETVIVDAGTTTLHVVQNFRRDLRIRALALSLFIADALADMPNVTLIMPAAQVRPYERSFIGSATTAMLWSSMRACTSPPITT